MPDHPILGPAVLLGFATGIALLLLTAAAAAAPRHWTPPVAGEPARHFRLGPDPFRRGQHRGVDYEARGSVRAACAGRVVFAGPVAGAGTVSVRCGQWRVTYAPLASVTVREGGRVGAGTRLGRAEGALHFGVRREGERFGYVDPLPFLGAGRAAPPLLRAPPRAWPVRPRPRGASPQHRPLRSPRGRPARPVQARPQAVARPTPGLAPWPVWLGLGLGLAGLVGAGRLRLPNRRPGGAACRASSTSSSSPTIPSSR